MYPFHVELFALIRAVFWFVFMDSWLLGPHVNLSPWLDAEAEEKQDTGMGGGGHLGSRVMSNPAELRLLVQMQKQLWAPHTTGRLALGSWGDHISVTKGICALLSSFDGTLFFQILLPKEAILEQIYIQAGNPSYPRLDFTLDGFRVHMHQQHPTPASPGMGVWELNDSQFTAISVSCKPSPVLLPQTLSSPSGSS